jgi:hypothetical protein
MTAPPPASARSAAGEKLLPGRLAPAPAAAVARRAALQRVGRWGTATGSCLFDTGMHEPGSMAHLSGRWTWSG